jgi:serine/threonine protein kinase
MVGQTVGGYCVLRTLGRGRVGEVHLAEKPGMGTQVAVKLLGAADGEDGRVRLERALSDAQGASSLNHPGIVSVLDQGFTPDGSAYVISAYLDGVTVRNWLAGGPELATRLAVAQQVALAMAAAHDRRIVHGALRPENAFLVGGDPAAVRLTDFGLGRLLRGVTAAELIYASPERCRRPERADANDDVYAFGVMLYEMACGRVPFDYADRDAVIAAHLGEPPPPPRSLVATLPPTLERLILAALCKSAAGRPRNLRTVAEALAQIAAGAPDSGQDSWPATRDDAVVPRLTPLGHVHLRSRDLRGGSSSMSQTPPRRTPLGQAHLNRRGLVVESESEPRPAGVHAAVAVDSAPLPEAPPIEAPALVVDPPAPSEPPRRAGRRLWWVLGVVAVAAAALAAARGLRSSRVEAETPQSARPLSR